MLHIIGMIFKVIGIILAVILGILVLLICIVLFVPLRYQADAAFDGTVESLRGHVHMSWLFHLISASGFYEQGELKWKARIAWKKIDSGEEEAGRLTEDISVDTAEDAMEDVTAGAAEDAGVDLKASELPQTPQDEPELSAQEIEHKDLPEKKRRKEQGGARHGGRGNHLRRLFKKLRSIWEKMKAFFRNIKYTFGKICDNIKILVEKKEQIAVFLEDEGHQLAFVRLKKETFRLLRFLKPKKFLLSTHFGFEDPYRTGQVLAVLGVIYPFVGGQISAEPDFENKVLEAGLEMKGKIRVVYAVIAAWNLFWDKNVRTLYADVKRMSGKE